MQSRFLGLVFLVPAPKQTIRNRPAIANSGTLEITNSRFLAYGHFVNENRVVQV
jgi:hypothetical protein